MGDLHGQEEASDRAEHPVAQTLQLGETASLPGQADSDASPGADSGAAGRYAWVIVFHDSLSPISDAFLTKFVVQMRAGWYVF